MVIENPYRNYSKKLYYTVYKKKTDTIIAFGTATECAQQLKCSRNCFYSKISKNRLGKRNTWDVVIEFLDDIEKEEP